MEGRVLVHGTGGMGREAAGWAQDVGFEVLGFLDDDSKLYGTEVAGLTVLGGATTLDDHPGSEVVVAIGAPAVRARLVASYVGRVATLVHPSVVVGRRTHLSAGVLIGPNAVISTGGHLGAGAIVNYGAVVGHDARLGEAVFVGPNAALAGDVIVGDRAWIGIGASVLPGLTIGTGAVVGAGAVVVHDVEPGATVVGVPARPLDT